MKKEILIIGAGVAGLTAAAVAAKAGCKVTVFEKNESVGGRAGKLLKDGFVFDKGPSWYWMPDVFENFFRQFNLRPDNFYELKLLSPSFSMFFKDEVMDIPEKISDLEALFESREKNGAEKLRRFFSQAEIMYRTGMMELAYTPCFSISEFINFKTIKALFSINLFSSFHGHVRRYFSDPKLISLLEFPILFLGALPKNTPALYSLMPYAGLKLGTWYPMGGFTRVIEGFYKVALEHGVHFRTATPVESIRIKNGSIEGLVTGDSFHKAQGVIAAADYHHVEQQLLNKNERRYNEQYWDSRKLAPSCLLFYVGVNKKIKGLRHHNLFFDEDFSAHASDVYEKKTWPEKPCFYVCCSSKTDDSVAPEGCENLFILIPVAAGLKDDPTLHEKYFEEVISRIERRTGETFKEDIRFKMNYCINDFVKDYNAYKGNAYGLANTLRQTAILKPSMRNKKVRNMFYAGQLTVPGPGLPPSIISGQLAANELLKQLAI